MLLQFSYAELPYSLARYEYVFPHTRQVLEYTLSSLESSQPVATNSSITMLRIKQIVRSNVPFVCCALFVFMSISTPPDVFFNSVSLRISSSNTSLFPSSATISRSFLPPKSYSSIHALISELSIRFSADSLNSPRSSVSWNFDSNASALNGQLSPPSECSFQFDSVNMAWVHRLPPFIDTSILPSPQKSQVFS